MTIQTNASKVDRHVLVVGAYGLIGYGITKHLIQEGFTVTGLGRDIRTASRVLPNINWVIADLTALTRSSDWENALKGVTDVVNCSGALQEGSEDHLEVVHHHAIAALADACSSADIKLIQISAVGTKTDASTEFLSSKARGELAIMASGAAYTIFRPGLVLAPHAYGGTLLLRMLAAVPIVQPLASAHTQIQTVSVADLAMAVAASLNGDIPDGYDCDLVEQDTHSLREVVTATRRWLGFKDARLSVVFFPSATKAVGAIADMLSWCGWRSPLRTTSLKVLADGVRGDPSRWNALNLKAISSMSETYDAMPASAETRLAARMALLTPVLIATLSLFWGLSGLIGLIKLDDAAQVLKNVGWPHNLAVLSVAFWAVVDLALSVSILVRRFAKAACWAMVGVSIVYLVASTIVVPSLWLEPLGPLVKVMPGIMLALVVRIALESR